jgi:CRISPR-associated protein Cas5d
MTANNRVTIRVWGDYACFTRPEMKVERVSYPIMTPSAARGVLEAIFWEPQMCYVIDRIAVVKRGRWFSFRRNEVSAVISVPETMKWMRGTKAVKFIEAGGGAPDAAQRNMLALAEVEYLVTAEVRLTKRAVPPGDNLGKYLDEVRKRASRGKCFHRPALGCREFAADFDWVAPEAIASIPLEKWEHEDLGLMLYDVFDHQQREVATDDDPHVRPGAVFFRAAVKNAVLECHPDTLGDRILRPRTAHPTNKE